MKTQYKQKQTQHYGISAMLCLLFVLIFILYCLVNYVILWYAKIYITKLKWDD